ncbi:MAG: adenylyltransferase/cytidyltransferase family protein [Clostridia bacterium]|nr:adenylyltransferase/cytidyltransferase family protein [Clostridia bacterium]
MKPYDIGLVVGRFQHFHIGHKSLVENAYKLCDRVLILVGSAQEFGTLRNPYPPSTRIDVIREIYGRDSDNLIVTELADMTNENDITPDWGKYVLKNVRSHIRKAPSLMVYGNDEFRSRWFAPEDIMDTAELVIPRSRIPISATALRGALVRDDFEYWSKFVDEKTHKMYDRLRRELLSVPAYREMYEGLVGTPAMGQISK